MWEHFLGPDTSHPWLHAGGEEREREGRWGTVGGWDGLKCRRGENRGGELAFLQRSARFPSL